MARPLTVADIEVMTETEIRGRFFALYACYWADRERLKRLQLCNIPMTRKEEYNFINSMYSAIERNWTESGNPTIGTVRQFMRLFCVALERGKNEITAFGMIVEKYSEDAGESATNAGESDALRGQVEAMKFTVQMLQNGIEDKQTIIDHLKTASQPKRPKLTQEEAADICGITVRTLQNWESGTTQAPYWYPGRDVTAVELKQRVKEGELQKRVTQAARKGERNARQLKEEKDQPDE